MASISSRVRTALGTTCLLPFALTLTQTAFATSTVVLHPGDDIQAEVKANPAGTAFVLSAGLYRGQSILAKNDDSFTGQGVVKFIGSDVLTFTEEDGFWVASAKAINTQHGVCQKAYPLCAYPQDLYIDNGLQTVATTKAGLARGSWYFDRAAGKVYLPYNPAGHDAEISMLPYAFSGAATGVHISNLEVERYANLAQFGAIGGTTTGAGWVVDNVVVRYNHGTGVKLGHGSQLLNSFIHHNGELGINLSGVSAQVIGNEISFNNYAGYALGWEAGGAKFSSTTNLLVRSNYSHDNLGPGFWDDTDNIGTTYENNIITHNESSGIQHELSFSAVFRNNVIADNGWVSGGWLWNAQILIQNSSDAEVYENTITVPTTGANGITIINQKRGSGPMGPWIAANNEVFNNSITYRSTTGASGMGDDTGSHTPRNNSFSSNHYVMMSGSSKDKHWCLFGTMGWGSWVAGGEDTAGSLKNLPAPTSPK